MSTRAALIVGVGLALATASPAAAAVAAAGPGGFVTGFVTPVVVVARGEAITFVNTDIARHDFVAADAFVPRKLARKAKWCSAFPAGKCPLFWSQRIGTGASTDVLGLQRVQSGKQYTFYCTVHPNMKGTLVVR